MKRVSHKTLVLPASELELIGRLQEWLGESRVVSFLARLARVQRVNAGVYSVASASTRDKSYRVDLNRRVCPCASFFYRRRCMHYKLAAVKHLLERP